MQRDRCYTLVHSQESPANEIGSGHRQLHYLVSFSFPLGRFVLSPMAGHRTYGPRLANPMRTLSIINPDAAGIDVGSEKLFVSIAGDEPVVFGTFTNEVYRLRDDLKQNGVKSVAMEATGVYWLYVYAVLEAAGLELVVVNGRY